MTDKIKEYPILFTAPMVRAILDDKKHMTRRLVKPQPQAKYLDGRWYADRYNHSSEWCFWGKPDTDVANLCGIPLFRCPYGVEGGRLWVKEAWKANRNFDDCPPRDLPEGSSLWWLADDSSNRGMGAKPGRYRHARFMPRWASRINLENTGVRIERVQDITEEDAIAEGMTPPENLGAWERAQHWEAREAFRVLWESINGPESWALNPWVWVISFRRVP